MAVQKTSEIQRMVPYRVFTITQATEILGVAPQAVRDAIGRRADNGDPVAWEPGGANPLPVILVEARWVMNRAADTKGVQAQIPPLLVTLPSLSGLPPEDLEGGEMAARVASLSQQVEGYQAEANQAIVARLEAQCEELRSENEGLRTAVTALAAPKTTRPLATGLAVST